MLDITRLPLYAKVALAGLAGIGVPLSLAPYNIWPFAILSLGLFALLLHKQPTKRAGFIAFAFGLGLYGLGASWVYVSIHQFGSTSLVLSLAMTSAFVAGLAFAFAIPFYAYGAWFSQHKLATLCIFPVFYVLGEWMRSWFLTGFPWLYVGYGHLQTPLGGWAPIFGVFGISLFVAFSSTTLFEFIRRKHQQPTLFTAAAVVVGIWVVGAGLKFISWTEISDKPIEIGMVQPNIPQELKWEPSFRDETFRIFNTLSKELWEKDWLIWPEAAIPILYTEAKPILNRLDKTANQHGTVFITGILYDNWEYVVDDNWQDIEYYNSLVTLGKGSGVSYKTRLVPFGEYVPMEDWLRGLIDFFDLPTSIIHPGPEYKTGLNANGVTIAPTVCYEVVYPDLVADRAKDSDILLTVSNDAWFGLSIGPIQHFEMAQMRALETGRYMIRSTNNGISGIINERGEVLVKGDRYKRENITGTVYTASGKTPFLIWYSYPIIGFCFLSLGFFTSQIWRNNRLFE